MKPFGEREGFPLPLEATGAFWIRLVSFFGGKNPGQVMFEAAYMCVVRAVSMARAPVLKAAGWSLVPSWASWPKLRAHLDCTSGAVHACLPADTVLFLPLCTRWHCQLS